MSPQGSNKTLIAVLGDTYADVLVTGIKTMPRMGSDSVVSNPIRIMLGGSGANTSVLMRGPLAVNNDGIKCELFTTIGSDEWGTLIRKHLEERDVELREAKLDDTGDVMDQAVCIVLSGNEGRGFISYRGCSSHSLTCSTIDTERILEADHLHIAGYFALPGLWKGLPHLFEECKRRGITTSVCSQTTEKEWTAMEGLYPYISVLIVNEDEGRGLAGLLPDDDVLRAATILITCYGIPLVVLTLGSKGAIAVWCEHDSHEGDIIHWMKQPSKEHLSIVDTTGAGDAFISGFLPCWKKGEKLQTALQFGCACGSAACQKLGGSTPLSNEEIKDCLLEGQITIGSFPAKDNDLLEEKNVNEL